MSSTESTPLLLPPSIPSPRARAPPPRALYLFVPLVLSLPLLLRLTGSRTFAHQTHPGVAESAPQSMAAPYVPISFLALGDWGRNGLHGQRRVAQAMADTVTHTLSTTGYNPHYILSTGDNFYKSGVASVHDDHFTSSYANVYNHTVLSNLPWYVVLGNHDHVGSISAQVDFTRVNARWNMPATYFAQRFAGNLVAIFLDTTPFVNTKYGDIARSKNKQSTQTQLRWLKRQLANTPPSSYFLIVGHHNLYTVSTGGHLGSSELREGVEPLLLPYRHRILAYISGHEHSLMHMQPYGRETVDPIEGAPFSPVVDHFISGAGSKLDDIVVPSVQEREKWYRCCGVVPPTDDRDAPRTVWAQSVHGFFSFRFDGRLFSADAVNDAGEVVYSYEKTVA